MARKKVGDLIKEARTGAGMTQEALARKIKGVTAQDISKAERGELSLTQAQLKEIAKATGVTQKSLLDGHNSHRYPTILELYCIFLAYQGETLFTYVLHF